jgi:hypothetical protein
MATPNTLFDSKLGDVTGTVTVQALAVTGNAVVSGSVAVTGGLVVSGPISFAQPAVIGTNAVFAAVNATINLTTATSAFTAAIALTAQRNVVVSVSFTSGGPVSLPTVATWIGGVFQVLNISTNTVAVWPQPLDIIDGKVTGTVVLIDAGKRSEFYAVSTTSIVSIGLGTSTV